MNADECRRRFSAAPVARLATVTAAGAPHLVPVTFALLPTDTVVTAVDHKPKRTTALQRLANIAVNPAVSLLTDAYQEDWSQLWWVRADGRARVLEQTEQPDSGEFIEQSLDALAQRYEQYRERRPSGPLIVIEVERFVGWSAAPGCA